MYAKDSSLESVAITAAMEMPCLLLQRPNKTSKSQQHVTCPCRRMKSWKEGDILGLLLEARTIQSHLSSPAHGGHFGSRTDVFHEFANGMKRGDSKATQRFLSG